MVFHSISIARDSVFADSGRLAKEALKWFVAVFELLS